VGKTRDVGGRGGEGAREGGRGRGHLTPQMHNPMAIVRPTESMPQKFIKESFAFVRVGVVLPRCVKNFFWEFQ
jgi:hypothetical protein